MAGAWAEGGSLPSIYFEVFEWMESCTLAPKYKRRGSKLPAFLSIRYTPRFPFSRQALYSPFPRELLVCTPHPIPATPIPPSKNPSASLTFRPLSFSRLGIQPPPRPFSRPLCLGSTCRPRKATLPPRPPLSPPPALGLTRESGWPRGPRFPPARSPRSDSSLAQSEKEASAWPRQASPPS